jgi:putative DNA primase/helicase
VSGAAVDVTRIKSSYVYEMAKSLQLPADKPMTDDAGKRLVEVMKMFRWSVDGSALLFAGWIALAPVCGAIPWRPHIWMTGGAGSGKSSLAKFGHALLKGTDVFAQGNSSEAGIRQRLRADARPVVMDESESNEDGDAKRIQSILGLIRQASTESDAETLKGTTDGSGMTYHIRSMFCLASIQVALKHKADIDRLTVLTLKSGKSGDQQSGDDWNKIKDAMYRLVGTDAAFRAGLLRRCIDLLPTTLKNIEVFSSVGAEFFGSQRDGDQYGALMAGAWSLVSTAVASREQASKMYSSYNWQELRDDHDADESHSALAALMEAHVRVKGGVELTVYELVRSASGQDTGLTEINEVTADAILQRYGMKIKDSWLVLSNRSKGLRRLMAGTTFEADYRGVLLRVDGADKNDNKAERFNGVQTKCFRIPLSAVDIARQSRQEAAF